MASQRLFRAIGKVMAAGPRSRITRATLALLVPLLLCQSLSAQQPSKSRYESILQNPRVHVFRLTLAPRSATPLYLANHDQVWISLKELELTLLSNANKAQHISLSRGDVRFIPHGSTATLTLESSAPSDLIVVAINARDHEAATCDCTGSVGRFVCGCDRASELPRLWAVALGNLTLAGTTMLPEQSFPVASYRNDMLLVAITPVALRDSGAASSNGKNRELTLNTGEVTWLQAGRHRFENSGDSSTQFVTLEF